LQGKASGLQQHLIPGVPVRAAWAVGFAEIAGVPRAGAKARLRSVVTEADLELSDGRTLHYYDTREDGPDARTAVFWHHGTPNVGSPPEPLFAAAAERGLRWVSYDRPGYLLAGVQAWGLAPADIAVPVLTLHGAEDRMVPSAHGEWLAAHCPAAELRLAPGAGHITVLDSAPAALEWLRDRVTLDSPG
jgi:pimeloyl-ACP methyl ester carboxylesterase